jgi:stearoyl-CoA desaturase (delta-9 desaturase)
MLLPDWAVLNAAIDWLANGLLEPVLVAGRAVHAGHHAHHHRRVTIFLHRTQAHRAMDLHAIPSHFFRFWLWLGTGMVTKEWVAIHRKHHAKCETVDDPHSPQTRGIETVLWRGAELYRAEAKNKETMAKFGHGTPNDWIERNLYTRYSWQGVGLMLILNVALFGLPAWPSGPCRCCGSRSPPPASSTASATTGATATSRRRTPAPTSRPGA